MQPPADLWVEGSSHPPKLYALDYPVWKVISVRSLYGVIVMLCCHMTTGIVANVIKANWQASSVNPLFPKRLFISKYGTFILPLPHSHAQDIPTFPVYVFGGSTFDRILRYIILRHQNNINYVQP